MTTLELKQSKNQLNESDIWEKLGRDVKFYVSTLQLFLETSPIKKYD